MTTAAWLTEDALRRCATGPDSAARISATRRRLLGARALSCGALLPGGIRIAIGIAQPWERWLVLGCLALIVVASAWSWATLPRRLAEAVDQEHIQGTIASARPCVKCDAVLIPLDQGACWRCGATQPLGRAVAVMLAVLGLVFLALLLRPLL